MRLTAILSATSALALFCACNRASDLMYVGQQPAALRKAPDPAAEQVRLAELGQVFKGKKRKDGWWQVILPEGGGIAFVQGTAFTPHPIPATDLYVVVPATARFPVPAPESRDVSAKYRIGDKVLVARGMEWIPEGWGAVLENGRPTGWVRLQAFDVKQPTAAQLVDSAVQSLVQGQYAEAIVDAERAFVLDTRDTAALSLVVALHEARGDREAPLWREKLGPLPKPGEPPVTVKGTGEAHVSAIAAPLRESASEGAEILAELAIGTKVAVERVQNGWAQVSWEGMPDKERVLEVDPFAAAPAIVTTSGAVAAAAPATSGWIRASLLDPAAPDRAALLEKGLALVKSGESDEGFATLERAATIPPADASIWDVILTEARKAKAWGPLARAAVVRQQGGGSISGFDVSLEIVYGCRGRKDHAEKLDAESIDFSQRLPIDACVIDLDPDECPPCDEYGGDYYEGDGIDGEGGEGELSEEDAAERAEAERLRQEEQEAREREQQEEAERLAEEQEERERWLAKLDEVFDSGHYVRVTLRNASPTRTRHGQKLVFYSVPVSEQHDGSTVYESTSLKTGTLSIPSLGPQEAIDLWVSVDGYRDVEYGVMGTEDPDDVDRTIDLWNEEAARSLAEAEGAWTPEESEESESEEEEEEDPWSPPPYESTSQLSPSCDCGGC